MMENFRGLFSFSVKFRVAQSQGLGRHIDKNEENLKFASRSCNEFHGFHLNNNDSLLRSPHFCGLWNRYSMGIVLGRVFGLWLSGAIATMALEQVRDSAVPADTGININIIWVYGKVMICLL